MPYPLRMGDAGALAKYLLCCSNAASEADKRTSAVVPEDPRELPQRSQQLVQLNVGGTCFTTLRGTLAKAPEGSIIWDLLGKSPGENGVYFLDGDGQLFHHVLNFLRDGAPRCTPPTDPAARQNLYVEALRLGLFELAQLVEDAFVGAALPSNEQERLRTLTNLGIWHTSENEERYDNITRAAQIVLDFPTVTLSLVGKDHQWYKSSTCDGGKTCIRRNASFCAHSLLPREPEMLLVEDALEDPRFCKNPLVVFEPYVRFYAGCPLVTADGARLGALCVVDYEPRRFSPAQAQLLTNFAQLAVNEIQRRTLAMPLAEAAEDTDGVPVGPSRPLPTVDDFATGPWRLERVHESLSELICLVQVSASSTYWPILYANPVFGAITGMGVRPPQRVPGKPGYAGKQHLSFWEIMRTRQQNVTEVIQDVSRAWCDKGEPTPFGLSLTLPCRGGNYVPTSCRWMPAQQPLDLAAAVIKQCTVQNGDPSQPSFAEYGHLYFVTMTLEEEVVVPQHKKALRTVRLSAKGAVDAEIHGKVLESQGLSHEDVEAIRGVREKRARWRIARALFPDAPEQQSPFPDVQLLRQVGHTSCGPVFFGLWDGSPVAVKILEWHGPDQQPRIEQALAQSNAQPDFVQTYKHLTRMKASDQGANGEDEVYETWIVQEWCDQGTLADFCKEHKADLTNVEEMLELCTEVARVGSSLHSKGLVHGDLAASSIMIKRRKSEKGFVCKISDFGLAEVLQNSDGSAEAFVRAISAPELREDRGGDAAQTTKVDIYAAGILLWQALQGHSPVEGLSTAEVVTQALDGERFQLPPGTPQIVVDTLTRCTAANPQERPEFNELVECFMEAQKAFKGSQRRSPKASAPAVELQWL